jgi:hypothetical protein
MNVTLADGTVVTAGGAQLEAPIYFPEDYRQRYGPRSHIYALPDEPTRTVSAVIDIAAREVRVWFWLRPEDVQQKGSHDDCFAVIGGWQPLPLDDRIP